MLDRESGEVVERTLKHDGNTIREFYAGLSRPVFSATQDPAAGAAAGETRCKRLLARTIGSILRPFSRLTEPRD
jgi:hypothetical protein